MDLSKLPRLSGAETTPPMAPPENASPIQEVRPAIPIVPKNFYVVGPELWISLIVGLLLIGVSRHFPTYLLDRMTGRTYHTGYTYTSDNTEVPYPEVEGFVMLSDAAIFAFGMALLCDAILRALSLMMRAPGRRIAFIVGLCLTLGATLLNAYVAIKLLHADIMPLISGMIVAFGGYMAFEQFRVAKS